MIGLLADHHKLVKFSYPDSIYEKEVEAQIKKLVHNALDSYESRKRFAAFQEAGASIPSRPISRDARRPSVQAFSKSAAVEAPTAFTTLGVSSPRQIKSSAGGHLPDNARSELDGTSQTAADAWVEDTIKILKFNQDERRINDVDDGSVKTCDWILGNTKFDTWKAPLTDSILFVQGGPGLGKSVLAKFLVQRFQSGNRDESREHSNNTADQSRTPIVAHFFPRGTEFNDADNSPKAILINLLYQIWRADSVSCN